MADPLNWRDMTDAQFSQACQRVEIERLQRDLEAAQAALVKAGKDKSDSEEQIAALQRENAELKDIEAKLEEYGGPEEAYKELVMIHRLFDNEVGHPYEGDECLSSLVEQQFNHTEKLEAKLAAAEADTKRLNWLIVNGASVALNADGNEYWVWIPEDLTRKYQQARCPRAAIDAAKSVEPDYCETDETAEFLRREDAAKTGVNT